MFAILFARNVVQDGCRTGGTQDKDVQDRRDAGNDEGSRTGEMQDMRDAAREGCRKGGMWDRMMQERRYSGDDGCWKRRMQDRRKQVRGDAVLMGCRTGGIHDRRDARHEG